MLTLGVAAAVATARGVSVCERVFDVEALGLRTGVSVKLLFRNARESLVRIVLS